MCRLPNTGNTHHVHSYNSMLLQLYEKQDCMKNNCCVFERLFKVQENGIFLFRVSFFFVLEILVFYITLIRKVMML